MVRKIAKLVVSATLVGALTFIGLINTVAGSLSVTNMNPNQGPTAGGQEVTIYGDFVEQGGRAVQIGAGGTYVCALDTNGQVYCWGNNNYNVLGHNSTKKFVPVAVDTARGDGAMNGKTIKQIAAGSYNTCALDIESQVYCWGYNGSGSLGNDSTVDSNSPVIVDTASGTGAMSGKTIIQISVGSLHVCALDTEGQVYCWGGNSSGQLGDNSNVQRNTPVAVNKTDGTGAMNGKVIVQIATGSSLTCALDTEGQVYCWGFNNKGQVGNGEIGNKYTPVAVNTIDGTGVMDGKVIKQISSSGYFACVLDTEGQVYCWGNNDHGQLGDGSNNHRSTPVAVNTGAISGKTIVQIAAGDTHTCALDTENQIYCWGRNGFGQLGDNTEIERHIPVAVNTVDGGGVMYDKTIERIYAGAHYTCALDVDGKAYCWGANTDGRLGNSTNKESSTPTCVHTILDGTGSELPGIGCGREMTVVMDADGTPAPCENIVIADDGLSLKCTTTAHIAGVVDVTISDGVNTKTIENGYEYIAPEVISVSTGHTLKVNIYDSTSLVTILDACDQIKSDQEANNTYTEETFNQLMKECEEGKSVIECLETAIDASECGDPGKKRDEIDDAINKLVPVGNINPPNTSPEQTWYVTALDKDYAIPILPFVLLSIATLGGIVLVAFLVRKRIQTKGINVKGAGNITLTHPWHKDSIEMKHAMKMIEKHGDHPRTTVVDVSHIVRKYRIKFVLWNTIPIINIIIIFIVLIFATAPTRAKSDYVDISLITAGNTETSVINVDKALSGDSATYATNIRSINTEIRGRAIVGDESGVYAKYSAPADLIDNINLSTEQITPGNNPLPNVELSNARKLIVPTEFDSTTLYGQHAFDHTVTLDLSDISDIPNGTYNIELSYTLMAELPFE